MASCLISHLLQLLYIILLFSPDEEIGEEQPAVPFDEMMHLIEHDQATLQRAVASKTATDLGAFPSSLAERLAAETGPIRQVSIVCFENSAIVHKGIPNWRPQRDFPQFAALLRWDWVTLVSQNLGQQNFVRS